MLSLSVSLSNFHISKKLAGLRIYIEAKMTSDGNHSC
jgi:hypothetical protein